jgi:hypothetical protein
MEGGGEIKTDAVVEMGVVRVVRLNSGSAAPCSCIDLDL